LIEAQQKKGVACKILIEGEIGEIGTGSEIHEEAPQGLTLTATEEAREFAAATGVDCWHPRWEIRTAYHGA